MIFDRIRSIPIDSNRFCVRGSLTGGGRRIRESIKSTKIDGVDDFRSNSMDFDRLRSILTLMKFNRWGKDN